jgi:chorismate--pyruvate lyase
MPNDTLWLREPLCPDAYLRRWLIDRGSLTERLRARCREFAVEVTAQGGAVPVRDERVLVGTRPGERALVREVRLLCDGRPMVFAHSVVSRTGLRGPWRMLSRLGSRPLGAALFADPRVRRFPLRFAQITRRHPLYARACAAARERPRALWARRSLFVAGASPLLVTEVFLPRLAELPS